MKWVLGKRGGFMEKEIGKVAHYFDKIGVAIVSLTEGLKVGDEVKFLGHGADFVQTIESLQVNHQDLNEAQKGTEVGTKVSQPVKEGTVVYRI